MYIHVLWGESFNSNDACFKTRTCASTRFISPHLLFLIFLFWCSFEASLAKAVVILFAKNE